MLKRNPLTFLLLSTALVGCANLDDSYQLAKQDFQQYEEVTKQYSVQESWWALYHDTQLNALITQGLDNNKNLAKAAINVNKALYQANLLGANLVPAFSGRVESSATRNIEHSQPSKIQHSGSINVSYTLDLWRRLADAASAGEWAYKASAQDLEAARLSLINSLIATYYQIAFLNDAVQATEGTIKYYTQINTIMQNRFKLGVADSASSDQAQQAVLRARNQLITYQTQRKVAEQTLRNLLNLKPNEALNIKFPSILNVKTLGVNTNVPVSTIANRPDIKSAQYRLSSAFKDAKAVQKSWFPTITLGASLASAGAKVDTALDTPMASGLISINLPFLSWNTVKWNVKISEANYELAKVSYEQTITTALNEIDTHYFSYQQSQANLANLQKADAYNKRITQYYKNRYDAGVSPLRDWLSAANTENDAKLAILNAKYQLIQQENTIYSAMAGYYSAK
ncbi:TPA: TolC family protein [Pasteurella multocida]|uniref:toxin/drug exporter TdeA n=1 Tax=Pasteurella multocida TaxID=747 RepID=UPI0002827A7C|nr:TolC family protein [Pasteurella multocida]ARB72778.1 TolC family protein [Pasteurella multocida]EJZ79233.1 RND efflux system, outer membrane lipoproteinmeC [Pasteurella multocida subsp. gallicida X73]MCL7791433.1 TolC family protein [Pasteurella multocida]MCL7827217.1 TolC family protein [Pasteurella multocida]MDC4237922.1 TolC family protein [Pasteurella multocida]